MPTTETTTITPSPAANGELLRRAGEIMRYCVRAERERIGLSERMDHIASIMASHTAAESARLREALENVANVPTGQLRRMACGHCHAKNGSGIL